MHFRQGALALAASLLSILSAQAAAQSSSSSSSASSSVSSTASSTGSTAAPTASSSPPARKQSIFVSPDKELAFGITIPDDPKSEDVYFTLASQPSSGWAAVGLGSDTMAGNPLILMIYPSEDGVNVTFSPRLATRGNAEPTYYPDLRITVLPGTGFVNDTLTLRARCQNCRRWPGGGGFLNVSSPALPCIYAAGPGFFRNNDADAPLKYHRSFGAFSLDMRAATSASSADAPLLNVTNTQASSGAAMRGDPRTRTRDWASLWHAVVMIFCFVGLLPLGIVMLRVGEWVRLHGINQGVAIAGIIVGFGLGIHDSSKYNRSKNFSHPHQIIGILVFVFLLAQFVIGLVHHRNHRKSEAQPEGLPRPKAFNLRPVHIWLGRFVMVMGVVNGFVGFVFALSPGYNLILAPLALAVIFIVATLLFLKGFIRRRLFGPKQPAEDEPPAYAQEPWRQPYHTGGSTHVSAAVAAPAQARGGFSGLRGWAKGLGGGGDRSSAKEQRGMELGARQHPRELV